MCGDETCGKWVFLVRLAACCGTCACGRPFPVGKAKCTSGEGEVGNGGGPVGQQATAEAARKPAGYEGDVDTEGSGDGSASEEVVVFKRAVQAGAAAASAVPSKGRTLS